MKTKLLNYKLRAWGKGGGEEQKFNIYIYIYIS